ncbi:hypothetical protein CANINC_000099 [Pichia inconspicua]|uniref:FAS1 domain-containing protein n=1 Tax=Pichia inconspicua TaxID=52247 RepID=A0A4T0X707_9ASCO|nr:hypothetical protein CANINC_000099 [[Candida] inconspicua]
MQLFTLVLLLNAVVASIISGVHKDEDTPTVPTVSIIDVLSANASFSTLLRILQRSDLIDYLNEVGNVTFLAPINEAFHERGIPPDAKLTIDEINRFIIDEPLLRGDISGVKIMSTLNSQGSPYVEDVHIPILVDHRHDDDDRESYKIENANVISDDIYLGTYNNVVLTIDQLLLDPKESVCEYFGNALDRDTGKERFKTFSSFLISDRTCDSLQMTNMTLFVPSDDSLPFNRIERKYLLHVRGIKDKEKIVRNFLVDGMYGGSLGNTSVTNWNHDTMVLSSVHEGGEIVVDGIVHAKTSNYLLADGIVHYFSNELFDYDKSTTFPQFTARKYLIGLDLEDFVDEVDFRRLSTLIDDPSLEQTIFVSNDYAVMNSLQNQMLYHFVEGCDELNGASKLLTTKYCFSDTQFCQKVKLQRDDDDPQKFILNGNAEIINKDPIRVGNTSIYIINDDITPPPKLQVAIASELTDHGKSITLFKRFGLLKELSRGTSSTSTVLFPKTQLWNDLDLTFDYLLAHEELLSEVLYNLVIDDAVLYHNFEGTQTFLTHAGQTLHVSRLNDTTLILNGTTNIEISLDSEILFSNGVVHPVENELPLPSTLQVSVGDLVESLDSEEFLRIVEATNSTLGGYSVLLPPSNALRAENITAESNAEYLEDLVRLHLIPETSFAALEACYEGNNLANISTTLEGAHIACRLLASGNLMLSLAEGSDIEVRVLRRGRAIGSVNGTNGTSGGVGGVYLIDRPLNPQWLDRNSGKLYLHLPIVAILVGILIGVVLLMIVVGCCLVITVGGKSGGEPPVGVTEHTPLIVESVQIEAEETGVDGRNGGFESQYSMNSSTSPIAVRNEV